MCKVEIHKANKLKLKDMPIKTCMILDTPFPPDIRVEKEARTLIRKGYEVHLLCVGERNETETVGNVLVHRVVIDRSSIFKRLRHTRPLFNFVHITDWAQKVLQLHHKENFSVIHAHDLTTAPYALLAGKRARIPVILDMHENYPEAQKAYRSNTNTGTSIKSSVSYLLDRLVEKLCIQNAFQVIVVVKERKDQLVNQGFDESKISILSNTIDVDYVSKNPVKFELVKKYKGRFIVTYIGGFGAHRGLETLIESVALIKDKISDLCLLLVGGRPSEMKRFKALCRRLGVENLVELVGWASFEQIPSYIHLSSVCIIPHKKSGHTDTTLPHKLFQYMFFEKPVIATDCLPLKRILQECNCGIVVKSGDPASFAEAIMALYCDPKLAEKLGRNGKKAVMNKYNWAKSEQVLLSIYERALTSSSKKIS
jgi:glycosyltransferase involved in cell wall biosynthesis